MSTIKEKTQTLHDLLEDVPFNKKMFRGEQTVSERKSYLSMHHSIFEVLDPFVPVELRRTKIIEQDMKRLGGMRAAKPLGVNDYIQTILTSDRIDGHLYLNYMGLLFGGQVMKKHYPTSSELYEFENIKGAREHIRENHQYGIENETWYEEQVKDAFRFHIEMSSSLGNMYVVE